ncbi:MAG TPA: tetratricopeptide repeat protein, partial [Flavobacterium sp.]|nr:tetratricopeptide repeat protein [Flavobacterium sp.]
MCLKKILFLSLLVLGNLIFAQNTNNLKSKLDNYNKQDTTRCFLLDQNIEAENDHNIWIKYNRELKNIAQEKSKSETNPVLKKTYAKYLSNAFNNEGAFYVYNEEFEKAIQFYRKSLQITTKINYDYGSAVALQNIGTAFDYLGKLDSTLVYMQKAYRYAKRSKNQSNLAYVLTDLGFVHNNLGNNALAIKYNLEALPLFEKIN